MKWPGVNISLNIDNEKRNEESYNKRLIIKSCNMRRAAKQSFWIGKNSTSPDRDGVSHFGRLLVWIKKCCDKCVKSFHNYSFIVSGFSSLCSSHLWFDFWYTVSYPHQNSARAAAGSYRWCNRLQKLFYLRFNSSNVFFTSLTCMPSPTEKSQCFWSNSHHMHLLEDEFETVWKCVLSLFWSGFLFSRVPEVLVYVPWVCSRVLWWGCTRKMGLSGSSVSDRRRMSNRLGGHLSLTLSRIATWTRLVAMDNS